MKDWLMPFAGVIAFFAGWQLLCMTGLIDPILLPTPWKTAVETWKGLVNGTITVDLWMTVERTLLSFLIAALIAVPLGVFLGSSERLYRSVEFLIDFFRSTPASAVFPLFLVLFGVGNRTKIAVATFGAALVILFNAAYGVINARKGRVLAARAMGASSLRLLTDVLFWESMPQILVGMRAGVSLSLIIVIVAEMFIGSIDGLGYRLVTAQMVFDMPVMYGVIFIAGGLGYGLNLLFLAVEKNFVHWSGK
jgi:ABC-type nitrate/sulfonate/bicarbonate transport system permease component